jgi:signal recognition particle receptor subunit beta
VLQGVDGIVFVADSAPLRMAENMASLAELKALLAGQAKSLESFPVVLECNKADLPGATPSIDLATSLHLPTSSAVRASAINGEGVFDALRAISKQVAAKL